MKKTITKPRNIICIIICLCFIAFLLYLNYKWIDDYKRRCAESNIEVNVKWMD